MDGYRMLVKFIKLALDVIQRLLYNERRKYVGDGLCPVIARGTSDLLHN